MTVLTRSRKKKYSMNDLIKLGIAGYKTHLEIVEDIRTELKGKEIDVLEISRRICSVSEHPANHRKMEKEEIDTGYVTGKRTLLVKKIDDIFPQRVHPYKVVLTEREKRLLNFIGIMLLDLTRCGRYDGELWQEVMGE